MRIRDRESNQLQRAVGVAVRYNGSGPLAVPHGRHQRGPAPVHRP
jgi:hypothetical protein